MSYILNFGSRMFESNETLVLFKLQKWKIKNADKQNEFQIIFSILEKLYIGLFHLFLAHLSTYENNACFDSKASTYIHKFGFSFTFRIRIKFYKELHFQLTYQNVVAHNFLGLGSSLYRIYLLIQIRFGGLD